MFPAQATQRPPPQTRQHSTPSLTALIMSARLKTPLTLGIRAGRFWSTSKMFAGADILPLPRTNKPSVSLLAGAGSVIANLVTDPPFNFDKVRT